MYTSNLRLTGFASGMDIDSMIRQLMNAESLKMNKLKQQRQVTEWKQAAYNSVGTTLRNFQNSMLAVTGTNAANSIRLPSNFKAKTTSVKVSGVDSTAITARATGSAPLSSFSLTVLNAAQKDTYVGKTIDKTYTGSKLDTDQALKGALKEGDSFTVSLDGGSKVTVTLSADDVTGTNNAEIITKINTKLASQFGNAVGGGPKVKLELVNDTVSFVAGKGHTVAVGNGAEDADALKKLGFSKAGTTAFNTATKLSDISAISSAFDGEGKLDFKINDVSFSFAASDTIADVMKKVNESSAGVTLSYDNNRSAFKLESNVAGSASVITLDDTDNFLTDYMGFSKTNPPDGASYTAGQDALIEYDGQQMYRVSNEFELNGVAITLTEAAAGKTFDINVGTDISSTMTTIVKFVDEYNNLVDALNKQLNTARPRSGEYSYYEPLTEDERGSMSDREIELWEEKAKTGLLHRDEVLNTINSQLRSMVTEHVVLADNSKLSLYDIGIQTSSADKYIGKLQIDETKLRKALEENIEGVAELFTKSSTQKGTTPKERQARLRDEGIGDRLNDIIRNAIDVGGSIYKKAGMETSKDSDLQKQLNAQDTKISDMLKYLVNRENYYYNMFSRMEIAMNNANNQMATLQSLMA